MIFKLGMKHRGIKLNQICINDYPRLTLTYFTARSNLVVYAFKLGKLLNVHIMVKTLQQMIKLTKDLC